MLAAMMPLALPAQLAVGGWTIHSAFNGVEKIVETDTYAYCMSGGSLFRVDKDTYEVNSLNVGNCLNDSGVTDIFGNPDGRSIVVAYSSGNLDRLYDDGKIVNMSDIKDAILSVPSRKINDIAFGKDNFYVAADFGLLTFDSKKNEVKVTAYSQHPVTNVFAMGNIMGVLCDKVLYFARQTDNITTFDKLKPSTNYSGRNSYLDMKGVGENNLLLVHSADNGSLYFMTVDIDNLTVDNRHVENGGGSGYARNVSKSVRIYKNGVYAVNDAGLYSYDKTGKFTYIPGLRENNGNVVSYYDDAKRVWVGSKDGISYMDVSNPANMVVIQSVNAGSELKTNEIYDIHVGASGTVYAYNLGDNYTLGLKERPGLESKVVAIRDGLFTDVSGIEAEKENHSSGSNSGLSPVKGTYHMFEDPDDPDAYYIGTIFEGVYRIKDGKQTHKYYAANSGFKYDGWACRGFQPLVDTQGNLWVYMMNDDGVNNPKTYVLGKEKRTKKNVTSSDWKTFPNDFNKGSRDGLGIVSFHHDMVVITPGRWSESIGWFNNKGTVSLDDDTFVITDKYIDQDGKELSFSHILAMCEDKKGRVWVGTDNGVFEITDPSKITSTTATVNHLKVPRNDGTNLADYLLDNQMVSKIAVDSSNRKWISTIGSGVYLVSENGDEIIEHYTTDNSILPSNTVYAVGCDPNSNKVYFGTSSGLVEYNSTSAPGKDDYSGVYAYPNPVRPDFGGWITVAGLMENSLVKIADSAGNVVAQGKSDGSMFVWDGCNTSGERVKSGVYYVMASQNASGSSSACVTKIMVIN